MTDYQIVCIELTSDNNRINRVGLVERGQSTSRATSSATPQQLNDLLSNSNRCFVTDEAGKEAQIHALGDNYIRSDPDAILDNNLRHLRRCNFSS